MDAFSTHDSIDYSPAKRSYIGTHKLSNVHGRNGINATDLASTISALEIDYVDVVETFVEKNRAKVHVNDKVYGPLAVAAAKGFSEICKFLLQQGAQINVDENSISVSLVLAAANGNKDTVALLLQSGANWESNLSPGMTRGLKKEGNLDREILR
ncbi:hypothetical protein MPDQ_008173 [Monascus purpureus]|uniref:Uncharacterized protein n=1 Tax=Monascus purpureus TaxID=5098 RepID=A0A507QS79_MONPU|nr:hypothetical protein MPDQ_008173 [Monascus purpureus]BDD56076.1 hypothetical protein MAP00_001553 [Monascus purpureus]